MESKPERIDVDSGQPGAETESMPADSRLNGSDSERTPMKYFVDFENVHGAGLKGIVDLGEHDEVIIFYSQAAETFHIEQAIDLLNSKAHIRFIEVDAGTRNALDFQLVAALFGTMEEGYEYAIVSGDGGYDAAVKMGKRLELPDVRRITDLTGSTEAPQAKPRRSRSRRKQADDQVSQEAPSAKSAKDSKSDTQSTRQAKNGKAAQTSAETEPVVEAKQAEAVEPAGQAQVPVESDAQNDGREPDQKPSREGGRRRRRSRSKHKIEEQSGQAQESNVTPKKLPAGQERRGLLAPGEDAGKALEIASASEAASASEVATQPASEGKADTSKIGNKQAEQSEKAKQAKQAKNADMVEQPTQLPQATRALDTTSAESTPDPAVENDSEPAKSGRYSKRREVKALLATNGIELSQQQLASVMKSLNGVKNKREFYNRIIREEKQQAGRELYHQVRDYYEAMVLILHG